MNNIFAKVLLPIFIIAIVPLSVQIYFRYDQIFNEHVAQIDDELSTRADNLANRIDAWMDTNLRVIRQNASHADIISMKPERQIPILHTIKTGYKEWVLTAFTVDATGQGIARSDNQASKKYEDRAWFQSAMKGDFGVSVQIGRSVSRPACAFAVPIFDTKQNRIGVLTLTSLIENISNLVTNQKIGQTGYSYILNTDGRVVAHYDKRYADGVADFSKHPVLAQLGKEAKKKVIYTDDKTNKKIIAFVKRSKFDWITVAQQEYDEAFASMLSLKYKILAFILSLLTITIVVLIYLAKNQHRLKAPVTIPVVLLILVLIPWGIEEYSHYQETTHRFNSKKDAWTLLQLDALANSVDDWIEMNAKMLRQNALLEGIKSMDPNKQKPLLISITQQYPWHWLAFIVQDGKQVIRSDNQPLLNLSERNFIHKAASGELFSSDVVISKTHGKTIWATGVPIFDKNQKVQGVLGTAAFLSDLSNYISNIKIDSTGYAYLLNDEGKLVVHQKKAFTQALLDFSKSPPVQSLQYIHKNKISYTVPNSTEKVQAYAQREKHGWIVVIEHKQDDINAIFSGFQRHAWTTLGIILLVTLTLAAVFVSRRPRN